MFVPKHEELKVEVRKPDFKLILPEINQEKFYKMCSVCK